MTHESNKDYYRDILFHPAAWTLQPDRMSIYNPMYMISRRPPPIETVGGDTRSTAPYVITDGVRMLEVFHVQDMAYELGDPSYRAGQSQRRHADGVSAQGKDPAERGSVLAAGAGRAAAVPDAGMRTLYRNMIKLKLDVDAARTHSRTSRHERASS